MIEGRPSHRRVQTEKQISLRVSSQPTCQSIQNVNKSSIDPLFRNGIVNDGLLTMHWYTQQQTMGESEILLTNGNSLPLVTHTHSMTMYIEINGVHGESYLNFGLIFQLAQPSSLQTGPPGGVYGLVAEMSRYSRKICTG